MDKNKIIGISLVVSIILNLIFGYYLWRPISKTDTSVIEALQLQKDSLSKTIQILFTEINSLKDRNVILMDSIKAKLNKEEQIKKDGVLIKKSVDSSKTKLIDYSTNTKYSNNFFLDSLGEKINKTTLPK
jgi:cell division protein FtsB